MKSCWQVRRFVRVANEKWGVAKSQSVVCSCESECVWCAGVYFVILYTAKIVVVQGTEIAAQWLCSPFAMPLFNYGYLLC